MPSHNPVGSASQQLGPQVGTTAPDCCRINELLIMMSVVSAAHFPAFPPSLHLFAGSAGRRAREMGQHH
uniref:Uncharacterized protein n=1 Tax=Geospiza parvula TaxID=87175 RepID=A0A8C3Q5T6_GEOPR